MKCFKGLYTLTNKDNILNIYLLSLIFYRILEISHDKSDSI